MHKPDGRVRLCIDLDDVNSKIIVERYPMPNIHEMLSTLESTKVCTTIDLSSAYHQILLTDESKGITAFITTEGFPLYADTLRSCVRVICVPTHDAQDIQGR